MAGLVLPPHSVNAPINTQLSDLSLSLFILPHPTFFYPLSQVFPTHKAKPQRGSRNAFKPNKKLIKLKANFPAKVKSNARFPIKLKRRFKKTFCTYFRTLMHLKNIYSRLRLKFLIGHVSGTRKRKALKWTFISVWVNLYISADIQIKYMLYSVLTQFNYLYCIYALLLNNLTYAYMGPIYQGSISYYAIAFLCIQAMYGTTICRLFTYSV